MSLKDPANLVQRIPELEALAVDPKIRRAIETGDPFKVYRALAWAKLLKRLPAHQETLKVLVRHRRLFAKPLNGTPALGTFNTVGFGFVGGSESESDGTYIATHAFVVLQFIPVIPLRSYLVRKVDSSLLSSKWNIFARVPSGMVGWLYSRTLALGLVALVGWGAVGSIIKSRTQDVLVVNGLDVPVSVELDGTQRTIAPMGRDTITVKTGNVRGKASAKGIIVDTLQQQIASSGNTTMWNIAGAAPVFKEEVAYFRQQPAAAAAGQSEPTVYCGQRYVELPRVDDPFTAPPQSVSMSKHTDKVVRTHLDIAKADNRPGYLSCMFYLAGRDGAKDAARFLEVEAELKGWDSDTTAMAMYAASAVSNVEAIRVAQRALRVHPDDIILHRRYQMARDDAGQSQQVLQEYADMAQRQPDSATAQYLYTSLLRGPAGVDALEKLAVRYATEPNILRSLTWRRMVHGNYAGTIDGWNRLRAMSPADAAHVADAQVRALVARQRAPEAAGVLASLLKDTQDDSRAEHLAEYLMVVSLAGGDPRRQIDSIAKDDADGRFDPIRARAGLEPVAGAAQQPLVVQLMLALRSDPAKAMRLAKGMSGGDAMQLGPEQWGLLFGEAVRTNDSTVIAKLEHANRTTDSADRGMLKRYLQGEAVSLENTDLEPGVRAAAMLVRSRSAALTAGERAQLRARAAQTDLLHSVVTQALARWPA